MVSSKRWSHLRWGALALLFLLTGVLGYFVSRAAALDEDAIRAGIVERLAAWSGGAVEVGGPFALHYFPDFALTMGTLKIAQTPGLPRVESVSASAVRVELGLRSLVLPEAVLHRITLTDLNVTLREQPKAIDPAAAVDARAVIKALRAMPVPEIVIVNGEISQEVGSRRETFHDVNAFAGVSAAGTVRVSGRLTWRTEKVDFNLNTQLSADDDPAAALPLNLILGGTVMAADVEGTLMPADGLRAAGSLSLQIPDVRRFTRWTGLPTPEGPGLGAFEASGGFRLTQNRLDFDEGTFLLDGNRALGALALDLGAARPQVSGTLAFSSFDIGPYLTKPEPGAPAGAAGMAEPEMARTSLLRHLDLDLRLSTSTVQAPTFTLGQAAVSASLKAGRLMADFAILDLCNGNGSGRIEFDVSQAESAIRLNGNFNRISAQECLQLAFGRAPLTADLDLFVELASKGRNAQALLSGLDGRVEAESGPGALSIDLAAFRTPAEDAETDGWRRLAGGSTAFSDLEADLILRDGAIIAERLKIRSEPFVYSGHGSVEVPEWKVDITVQARTPPAQGAADAARNSEPEATATLMGPLSRPILTVSNDGRASPGATAPDAMAPTR